jgi:outer membrane receptor for ferrienterochelin and colicins
MILITVVTLIFAPTMNYYCLLILLLLHSFSFAQDSIPKFSQDEIIITATRAPQKADNIAVVVSVISKKQIQQIGALKVNEVLQEQTGMFITNGTGSRAVGGGVFGNGLQLQGLSPDHTLILIDGEPVNGRQGGVLDLSRITIGNIKSIEIIKGPFSSLYGSEAMGGVVNIITESTTQNTFNTSIRYGSFNTIDVQAKYNWQKQKWSGGLFANAYTTKGYDLNNNDVEKTSDPSYSFSQQLKLTYQPNEHSKINFTSRLLQGFQQSNYAINATAINIGGQAQTIDFANGLTYQFLMGKKNKATLNLYHNLYRYAQHLDSVSSGKSYYKDQFDQQFFRAEQLTNFSISKNYTSVLGYGYTFQDVNTIRYNGTKYQHAIHLFSQNEIALNKFKMSMGGRFDYNSAYRYSLNPKLAIQYKMNGKLKLSASVGSGFKAPDFRQLYLNFINNAADNYIIYGASQFSIQELNNQLSQGFLDRIYQTAYDITTLKPEQSIGYNVAATYHPSNFMKVEVNLFRNELNNLINFVQVAQRSNGAPVFSYININKSFTQGAETNLNIELSKHLQISAGYQFLLSGDKAIVDQIQSGKVYGRDEVGGSARLMKVTDYFGLNNRSKHAGNVKLNYNYKGYNASARVMMRGKWGVVDLDGNGFANFKDEFAKGFALVNLSLSKQFNPSWVAQLGANNITNYVDSKNLTSIPSINFYTSISYTINNKNKAK